MQELRRDLKEIKSDIQVIKITMGENTATLVTHIARTELNERRIESLEKWLLGLLSAILVAVVAKGGFR